MHTSETIHTYKCNGCGVSERELPSTWVMIPLLRRPTAVGEAITMDLPIDTHFCNPCRNDPEQWAKLGKVLMVSGYWSERKET